MTSRLLSVSFSRGLAALLLCVTAACVPYERGRTTLPTNEFLADPVRVSHDVVFASGATAISPAQSSQIRSFLAQVGVQPGDELVVAGHGPLGFLRADGVQAELAEFGVASRRVDMSTSPRDVVTLSLTRTVYLPTSCIQGNRTLYDRSGGVSLLPLPRCSNDLNLARMIADPEDLTTGRELGPAEGVYTLPAIEGYRRGTATEDAELLETF